MKQVRHDLRSWVIAAAAAAALAGCGGGGGQSLADGTATAQDAGSGQARRLAVIGPVTPPPDTCTVSAPVVGAIDFGQPGWAGDDAPGEPVAVDTPVAAAVLFTDDPLDLHTVQWSWGDGSPATAGTVTQAAGAGRAVAGHGYTQAGVYTVTAVVADACASAEVTRQIVVYDPTAGFVTGGGWIGSPAGAYAADPGMAGRATFGFVSKYHKGATAPSGQTEFQFHAAKLNFHSLSYDWLVVAGARAQYKGSGSVNGVPGYGFMLTAVDGRLLQDGRAPDRFRIKIWRSDAGGDVVVYDNQVGGGGDGETDEGTALGGGNIVIHK